MRKFLFWFLAVIITLASAVYQRVTGPTHPLRVKAQVEGEDLRFRLPRSAETTKDAEIAFAAPEPLEGHIEYMRFKTDDPWTRIELERRGDELVAFLPKQPAAGKLAYRVFLGGGWAGEAVSGAAPVIIRFKDPVPTWLIIPHVIVIFGAMLCSTAAGLAALGRKRDPRRLVFWAVGLLFVGGFILGPLVQKYAFGVLWAGFPLGTDLTDNKTAIAFLFWIAALVAGRKGRPARGWIVAAAVVTLVVFLIPHSLLGSELDYSKMPDPGSPGP
jgi:hypothetical protein